MASEHFTIDRNRMRNLTLTVTVAKTTAFWMRVGLLSSDSERESLGSAIEGKIHAQPREVAS